MVLSRFEHDDEMRGIAEYARKENWSVRFVKASRTRIPEGWGEDGIIIVHNYKTQEMLDYLARSEKPKVSIGRMEFMKGVPFVSQHLQLVGRLGAEYFIKAGFKHLSYPLVSEQILPELNSFKKTVLNAGRTFHPIDVKNFDEEIKQLPKPLALMAADDDWAVGIFCRLEELGIAVPEEVALLGASNNSLTCELNTTPLSSLDLRYDQCGYQAAALLDRIIDGEQPASIPIMIEPGIVVVRDSTSTPPIENVKVAQAVRQILSKFREPLDLNEIAADVGLSRWSLDVAFRESLGKTMTDYLQHCRMSEAEKLLLDSDYKVNEIARRVGYVNHVTFLRAFHRLHDCSPTEFRKHSFSLNL